MNLNGQRCFSGLTPGMDLGRARARDKKRRHRYLDLGTATCIDSVRSRSYDGPVKSLPI